MTEKETCAYALRLDAMSFEEVIAELVRAAGDLVEANELNEPGLCHFGFVVALQRIQVISAVADMHGTDFIRESAARTNRKAVPSNASLYRS